MLNGKAKVVKGLEFPSQFETISLLVWAISLTAVGNHMSVGNGSILVCRVWLVQYHLQYHGWYCRSFLWQGWIVRDYHFLISLRGPWHRLRTYAVPVKIQNSTNSKPGDPLLTIVVNFPKDQDQAHQTHGWHVYMRMLLSWSFWDNYNLRISADAYFANTSEAIDDIVFSTWADIEH